MIGDRRKEFVADLVHFVRRFVDAFRAGAIPGISPSGDHPPV
jgi:hypothetical protein